MRGIKVIRKFKALGLSLFAVLALGAGGAAAAQAASWTAESHPAAVKGVSAAVSQWTWGNGSRVIGCASTYEGTLTTNTTGLQVAPAYSGCTSTGGLPTTFSMNGCSYTWTATTATTATQTVSCPAGQEIRINIYATAAKQKEGITACELGIPAQGPVSGIGMSNQGVGHERYVAQTTNVSLKATGYKGSKLLCGAAVGETVNAANIGNVTITGGDAFGPIGIWVA
jgi:hypothetical protein